MKTLVLLAAALATATLACTDDGTDAASTTTAPTTSTAPTTTEPPAVTARYACGPTDAPTIEVEVGGSASRPLTAELVIDGRTVARSSDGRLVIVLLDVSPADRVLLSEGDAVPTVRVRDSRFDVIAETTEIAPNSGGCG